MLIFYSFNISVLLKGFFLAGFSIHNPYPDPLFRYLFSFLASLVELDVFTDVHINYLLVGHTGRH